VTDADFDKLVAEHAAGWLRDAAALCRTLDPPDDERTVHVLDAGTLPQPATRHALAWTAGGLDVVLRDRLRDRRRGPVLVLDAAAIVRHRLQPATLSEHEAVVLGRLEVSQVALHELGHAATFAAHGGTVVPAGTSVAALVAAIGTPTPEAADRRHHDREWCRAYLVLSSRAARSVWPREWWLAAALADVGWYVDVAGRELVDALGDELTTDEPLVDLLRRPAPAAYLKLFLDPLARKDS
jgi:hypothetical protein